MRHKKLRALRELAYYSSIGMQVAFSIFIGLGAGVYFDRKFATGPWLTLTGLVLGIAAAYRNIGFAIKKSGKL